MKLCLDLNQYPSDALLYPDAAGFQGPALLAYNDAVFTDEDFTRLCWRCQSMRCAVSPLTGANGLGLA
jgi:sacsin